MAAGIAAIGGFARNFGVAVADVQDLDKLIVRTCKGQTNHEEKQKVLEFFGKSHLKTNKFKRPESVGPDKVDVDTFYYPVHLALIYNNEELLDIYYSDMEADKDYFREVIDLKVETSLECVDNETVYQDEVCGVSTMFLAVKYNEKALSKLLELAAKHSIQTSDIINNQTEMRGFNLLQFSTLNKTLTCMK